MDFEQINDELDKCLERCSVVKKNLRKNCSFSVELKYRVLINFIGMGEYVYVEPMLEDLQYHPETSLFDNAEIMSSIKDLCNCAAKLDALHDKDALTDEKSTERIVEESNIFAAKVGRFLEQ